MPAIVLDSFFPFWSSSLLTASELYELQKRTNRIPPLTFKTSPPLIKQISISNQPQVFLGTK